MEHPRLKNFSHEYEDGVHSVTIELVLNGNTHVIYGNHEELIPAWQKASKKLQEIIEEDPEHVSPPLEVPDESKVYSPK